MNIQKNINIFVFFYYLLNLKGRRVDNHFKLSTYEKENYKIKVVKFDENKILINGEEIKGDLIPRNLGVANIEVYRKV